MKRHLEQYGHIVNLQRMHNPRTGTALGNIAVEFQTHSEARRCVEKEHLRKGGLPTSGMRPTPAELAEGWSVHFDADRNLYNALEAYVKNPPKEEKEKPAEPKPPTVDTPNAAGTPSVHIPSAPTTSSIPIPPTAHHPLPPRPDSIPRTPGTPNPLVPSYVKQERLNWKEQHFGTAARVNQPPPERNETRGRDRVEPPNRARTPEGLRQRRMQAALAMEQSSNRAGRDSSTVQGDAGFRESGDEGKEGVGKEGEKEKEFDEEMREKMRREHAEVVRQLKDNGNEYLELYLPAEARKTPVKESVVREIFEKKCITPAKVSTAYLFGWFLLTSGI